MAVTDHNTIKGALEAKKYEAADIQVIIGEEISTDKGDLIGLFIKEEIKQRDFYKAVEEIKKQGGIAVLAHPFKRTSSIEESVLGKLDAIESFNSRAEKNNTTNNNFKASALARKSGLIELAGSDAHFLFEIGRAFTVIKSTDVSAIESAIRSGKTYIRGTKSSPLLDFFSQFIKMIKLRRPSMLLKAPGKLFKLFGKYKAPVTNTADVPAKLNVLLVLDDFSFSNPGGAGTMLYEYAKNLSRNGHSASLLFRKGGSEMPLRGKVEGMNIFAYENNHRNTFLYFFYCIYNTYCTYREVLKTNKPDIINCQHPLPGLGIRLLRRARNIPMVCSFHASWEAEYISHKVLPGSGPLMKIWFKLNCLARRYIEKYCMFECDKIIVMSEYTRDILLKIHGVSSEKVKLIPGGVDTDIFKPAPDKSVVKNKLFFPKNKFVLFTVRRLVPRMGLENLINAVSILSKQRKDILLIIGGIGPLEKRLKELTASLNAENYVRFAGFIPTQQLPLYYQAADLFVLPTIELEGFGLVTLEALSSGLPVLGTAIGGTTEILSGFNTDYLFKDPSPETMSRQISDFISHTNNISISAACRDYALTNYSWRIIISHVESLLREVLEAKIANGKI